VNNNIDKVIVITGASSGIGEATARLLAAKGAKLILGARNHQQLARITDEIKHRGGEAVFRETNVANREDMETLTTLALSQYGRLDVLISNAGIAPTGLIDELAVQDWDMMIDVNLRGFLYGVAAALPIFRSQKSGHFVTTISTAGLRVVPSQAIYAGTKNAVRTIMEGLRQESRGEFRVTGISPGFVQTNLVNSMRNPQVAEQVTQQMADLGISPESIAKTISFAIEQPANVDIGDIIVRPTAQG